MIKAPPIEVTEEYKRRPDLEAVLAALTRRNRLALQLVTPDELGSYGLTEAQIEYFLPSERFGQLPDEGEHQVAVDGRITRSFTVKDEPAIGWVRDNGWVVLWPVRDKEHEELFTIGYYNWLYGSKINPREFHDQFELFKARLLEARSRLNGLPVIVRQTGLYWISDKRNYVRLLKDPLPLEAVVRLGWQRHDFPTEMFA